VLRPKRGDERCPRVGVCGGSQYRKGVSGIPAGCDDPRGDRGYPSGEGRAGKEEASDGTSVSLAELDESLGETGVDGDARNSGTRESYESSPNSTILHELARLYLHGGGQYKTVEDDEVFRHTLVVRILQCSDVTVRSTPWIKRVVNAHEPDIGVYTGMGEDALAEIIERIGIDLLVTPGVRDDRATFESLFGRRYRIDQEYPFIDRTVHIGGLVLILLDTSDEDVTPQQRMWLESVLADLNIDIVRGVIAPDVIIFSYVSIFSNESKNREGEKPLRELLLAYSRGPMRLTVFSGEGNEESHTVIGGIHQYTTPPADTGVRMIQIDRFQPIESVVIYRTGESDDA
jgi:hypothetical protein